MEKNDAELQIKELEKRQEEIQALAVAVYKAELEWDRCKDLAKRAEKTFKRAQEKLRLLTKNIKQSELEFNEDAQAAVKDKEQKAEEKKNKKNKEKKEK